MLPTGSLFSQSMMDERAGGGGRSVAISHPHKGFFCVDQWSLKRKQISNVELKIYDVDFEIWRRDWRNAASEYRVQNWPLSQM